MTSIPHPTQPASCNSTASSDVQNNSETKPLWGKQTRLSLKNFDIGSQVFSADFIDALVNIKCFAAKVNYDNGILSKVALKAITYACNELLLGRHRDQFPLRIWQTGSGTQTNMNVNEVICSLANEFLSRNNREDVDSKRGDTKPSEPLHPNDHINMSQSSNDVIPTAMHLVTAQQTHHQLLPAVETFLSELRSKQQAFEDVFMVGRTHMMDAVPLSTGAIFSAYHAQLSSAKSAILDSLQGVYRLALGGTAVGSGCNAADNFGQQVIQQLATKYDLPFVQHENLYAAVSGEDSLLRFSAALKQLAGALLKMANDIRLLGSGPKCGLNELHLPANEPGSSIMPGKVNPTQCEALSMVCLQVYGNDLTVSMAASQGQLQLNTYRPVIIFNVLFSIEILSDAMRSFTKNCLKGLELNRSEIDRHMRTNLSVITLLAPKIGYDQATKIVNEANDKQLTLEDAAESIGLYSQAEFQLMLKDVLKKD